MGKSVFILGAGASVEAGAPLMADFLDVADDLLFTGKVKDDEEAFRLVAKGRSALQATHSKSVSVDVHNMEAVFSAFEMGRTLGRLGQLTGEDIEKLTEFYPKVIARTLEETITFPSNGGRVFPPTTYDNLVKTIEKRNLDCSVITFNYDVALDFAFYFHRQRFTYCLNSEFQNTATKLLKLHGSLNWTKCSKCRAAVPFLLVDFFSKYRWNTFPDATGPYTLHMANSLLQLEHCGSAYDTSVPYIVPPTWNKANHSSEIESVWKQAAKELAEAENIFVIGYSLPDTDVFFRYLFSLGVAGERIVRRFWVFDPSPEIEVKYRNLLGPSIASRFRFFPLKFSESLSVIEKEI